MQLSQFYSDIEAELTRGTRYTSRIPQWVAAAGMWIERNYTLDYMWQFRTFTIAAADGKRTVSFPEANGRVKRFEFLRMVKESSQANVDARYHYLNGPRHPKDITLVRSGDPDNFWLDGIQYLWLDAFVTEDRNFEIYYARITDWLNLALTDEPWLVNYAYDTLLARTMLTMLPGAWQAKRRKAEYRDMLQEGLKTLIDASLDLNYGGVEEQMQYVPPYGTTST